MASFVMITSDHRRHRWVASQLASEHELLGVVCEGKPADGRSTSGAVPDATVTSYFLERKDRESFWFKTAPENYEAFHTQVRHVSWGRSGDESIVRFVTDLNPDLVILFGSSIIKEPLLSRMHGRIINMHLGLSPYYRGSATNFWPLVDRLPECVGVTVHHATLKVDGGNMLLQARPDASKDDDSHGLGCKTILAGAELLKEVARQPAVPAGVPQAGAGKLCKRADFSAHALRQMLNNFGHGMMPDYLADKSARDRRYPIVSRMDPTPERENE